jgi:hypothetical protein
MECQDTPSGMVPWQVLRGRHAFGCNGKDVIEVPTHVYACEPRMLIKPLFPLRYVKENKVCHTSSRFGADTGFFLQLLSYGLRLRYLPRAMYYYRITPGSMSGLTNRCALFQEVMENVAGYFAHAPDVQAAIHEKISRVARSEHYMSFLLAMKSKDVVEVLKITYHFPWVIPQYFCNLLKSSHYVIHRIWHGGRGRGMR